VDSLNDRRQVAVHPPELIVGPLPQRLQPLGLGLGTVASADHGHRRPPPEDMNAIGDAQD
jgi:hypothetical protein